VRNRHLTRILAVPAALALGLSLFTVSLTFQVPAVRAASGPLDAQANEIVRLMNGARGAAGKGALAIDVFLASKARDGAIPCPDDATKTIAGRAQDMAVSAAMNHNLRLCDSAGVSGTAFVTVMQSWGYGSVGENLGVNGGYGNGAYLYQYVVGGVVRWQTWTYSTTGHIMGSPSTGWQSSSGHWNIIMGSYDRVGCGGWASSSGYFYACEFARGGPSPSGLRGAPTGSPFGNPLPPIVTPPPPAPVRTAAPPPPVEPAGPAYTSAPTPADGMDSSSPAITVADASGIPTAAPTTKPTASPTAIPIVGALSHTDATATTTKQHAAALSEGDLMTSGTPVPASIARAVVMVAGTGAGLLSACLALISIRRRRRDVVG
jgi:hypothetical protein